MPLSAGTRFGSYEISALIGVGGMGEVYRATDTKLGREVAIKTLPAELASDKDRLARFEREAKLLAALNHAHIASVYSLDGHDGTLYLAMELVDGETLERKLARGRLPIEEALRLALQVAEALEAAHEKGVVHRDLKPANVMVSGDGQVKVLDFGLAKSFSADPKHTVVGRSPALSLAMTQQGLVLGTAGYMSPEQASGQATDQRADIWAFGVVLYEMLTGKPVFTGESVPHILADVLKTEPDWSRLPKNLHPRLKLLLERCLEKNARDRYHSIADVRVDIEEALSDPAGVTQRATIDASRGSSSAARVGVAVVTTGVVAALIGWALWPAPEPQPVTRFEYTLPGGLSLISGSGASEFALSPNGRLFVYTTADGLYLRSMDDLEARRIPGVQGVPKGPFFSPDGQSIAYYTVGELKRIAIGGGASATIAAIAGATVTSNHEASWAPNGMILFGQSEGVFRVSATGGKPELVIPAQDEERVYGPQLLPDGDSVLFTTMTTENPDEAQIVTQSLSTRKRTVLVSGGYDAHYVPGGYLIYMLGDSLFAVAFDARRLAVSGSAVPVVRGIATEVFRYPAAFYAVSSNGTLVFTPARSPTSELVWVDRAGREESLGLKPCYCHNPSLSPDGTRVVLTVSQDNGKNLDLSVWSLAQRNLMRLTFEGGLEDAPVWRPDSAAIAYRVSPDSIFLIPADGTGARKQLLRGSERSGGPMPRAWTSNGDLIFSGDGPLQVVAVNGAGEPRSLPVARFHAGRSALSPDGHWLAYESRESGESEIYVRPYPDIETGKWQISSGGGEEAKWARDGHTLFFLGPKSLMASRVESAPNFKFQTPEAVFDRGKYQLSTPAPLRYDVSADGQRFLVLRAAEGDAGAESAQVVVVEHWDEELKRLVSTR
jgi:serine/threonine-protein kinase